MLHRQDVSSAQKESRFGRYQFSPEILVVDDDDALRSAIVTLLTAAGFRVQEASGGTMAQRRLGDFPPALVLTDLWMPEGDGWELLLHCQERWPLMPVLLMSSGQPGLHPEIECWAAGFLPKPFNPAQLLSEVGRVIARRAVTQNPNPAGFASGGPAG